MTTGTAPARRASTISVVALVAALIGGIVGMDAVASHLSSDRSAVGAHSTSPSHDQRGTASPPGTSLPGGE